MRKLLVAYAAGSAGALANSIVVWLLGWLGTAQALGIRIAPAFTAPWLYPRLVWGGLWGLMLLLPAAGKGSAFSRGFLLSLAPTLVQLLYFFPYRLHKGMLGLELGTLTPLLVVLYNAVWGIAALALFRRARG